MSDDLGTRLLAAIVSKNAELRKIHLAANPLRFVADAIGFNKTYDKLRSLTGDDRYDAAAVGVIEQYALQQLNKKIGIELSEISEKGLAKAIGTRAGFDLRSLHDMEIVEEDLMRAAADRIMKRMDWASERVIKKADDLIAEMEQRAADEIKARVPGLVLHNLRDVDRIIEDFIAFAAESIRNKTGLALRDPSDVQKVKEDMLTFADTECRKRLGIKGTGGGLKMTKKAIKNRLASRRFYAAHGDRHKYKSVRG